MTTYTVTATATAATTNKITVATTDNMFSGMPIVFSGTTFGGITAGATYYIGTITVGYPTSTITVTSLPGGGVYVLTTATGTMTGTFNSGGQQIINTVPPGEPLNESFNSVNLNFDQVFAAGPVGSNIQIANNTILTTNTNGNLVLAPNGVGVVQSNVSIVPNASNIRNLGSNTQRWSSLYAQYVNISGNLDLAGEFSVGDMTVTGNLTVTGNTIQIGNIVTETLTIQLANAASTANAANGSGITVGLNDNIATMLYSSTSNTWNTNIGISATGNVTGSNVVTGGVVSATGNITGNYFIGNGSQLTGLAPTYSNSNVTTFLASFGSNTISTSGNITGGNILGNIQAADGNTSVMFNQQGFLGADAGFSYDYGDNTLYVETVTIEGKNTHGDNALYVGVTGFTPLGSNVVAQLAGNADSYTQINFQNISDSPTASGDYIITANNGTDSSNFINMGIAGNTWNGTQTNSLGNAVAANDGYLYVNGGNLVVGTYLNAGNVINTWKFDNTGNLNLPPSGNIVGVTANNSGHLSWFGNSSGDNNGYTTLRLVPDDTRESADQYLIIDPTAPGHIHIRAGGTQDNSGADLILGGENSYVKVTSGTNPPVYVSANNQSWMFGVDGVFQAPGDISTVGNILTISDVSATGDIIGENFGANGNISAIGNITGTYILGNGSQLTGLSSSYSNSNVTTLLAAYGSNTISTTGNVNTGNITSGNVLTGGLISATGNITGGNILGNGYQLTGVRPQVTATNSGGALNIMLASGSNGPSNAVVGIGTSGGPATINPGTGQLVVAGATVGGYGLLVDGGGQPLTGAISATGNIKGANLLTAGYASITGNITSSNVIANNRVITTPVALANLTVQAGSRAFISDGNLVAAGNFGTQIGSGGSNVVPVWSDGTNWYIG